MTFNLWFNLFAIATTTAVFTWYATGRQPFAAAGQFLRDLRTSRIVRLHFLAMLVLLVLNKMEQKLEQEMNVPVDFTPLIYSVEGDFVYWVQRLFEHPVLTYVLTYFYVVVLIAMIVSSLLVYSQTRHLKAFLTLTYALMLNYLVAIPFYLFFPVVEVWAYHPKVAFLIPQVYPGFETEYRPMSGLDNCFPSLHTSLSVTLALVASRCGYVRFARLLGLCAGVIIFSIFYLGIHWLSDMTAGLLLALFAAGAAERLAHAAMAEPKTQMYVEKQ
ncbi:phosphatase PAP2 family protein [Calditerricola satsumensis]|uniref:Inositolphosphotransferase Aur1/Ipt1 domain-containing protein n=1 Tax=Calditerricola satsumensis TaxID=373054 RepID=A0A8J3B887_9BACI|nr:phosphatase PAP2 family protein [Calditerricola satsumensis]GGK01603.1 hypothetical protein GCM10007043_14540 [Calditerricola satsumensis]